MTHIKRIHDQRINGKRLLPVLILGITAFCLCWMSEWYADSIAYSFKIPDSAEGVSYERVSSLSDIWKSQVNHYKYYHGRFECTFTMQIFCELVPKWCWCLTDSFFWMLLALGFIKVCAIGKSTVTGLKSLWGACIIWLSAFYMPFDPAFHINYIWGGALNLWIVSWFLSTSHRKWFLLPLLALAGTIVGEWNESFSIPIGVSMLAYAMKHRFRIGASRWCLGVGYGIGTLILCLAPSNFSRLGLVSKGWSILNGVEGVWPYLILPTLCLFVICIGKWRRILLDRFEETDYFLLITAGTGYLMAGALHFCSGARMLVCPTLAIGLLLVRHLRFNHWSRIALILPLIAFLTSVVFRCQEIERQNTKYKLMTHLYHISTDGRIYLPDDVYATEDTRARVFKECLEQVEREKNPSKPELRILPESAGTINMLQDTNMCIQYGDQSWIMVRSNSHPTRFVIEKTFLPGILDIPMAPRIVDFSNTKDIAADSSKAVTVAVYVNRRPYIRSNVVMK